MIGIAFDFGGTSFVAFHEDANRIGAKRHGGGIEIWFTKHHAVRLLHIRHDVRFIGAAAARQACKRQRCTHQLQEIAAIDGIIPFRSLARKFAVEQILEMGVIRKLFQCAPVLFAGFVLQFFADSGEVQGVFAQRVVFDMIFMLLTVSMIRRGRILRSALLQYAQFVFVCVLAHSIH